MSNKFIIILGFVVIIALVIYRIVTINISNSCLMIFDREDEIISIMVSSAEVNETSMSITEGHFYTITDQGVITQVIDVVNSIDEHKIKGELEHSVDGFGYSIIVNYSDNTRASVVFGEYQNEGIIMYSNEYIIESEYLYEIISKIQVIIE